MARMHGTDVKRPGRANPGRLPCAPSRNVRSIVRSTIRSLQMSVIGGSVEAQPYACHWDYAPCAPVPRSHPTLSAQYREQWTPDNTKRSIGPGPPAQHSHIVPRPAGAGPFVHGHLRNNRILGARAEAALTCICAMHMRHVRAPVCAHACRRPRLGFQLRRRTERV